jgi:prepilin-type N-terminal cleavage/methylation domain-containing protein
MDTEGSRGAAGDSAAGFSLIEALVALAILALALLLGLGLIWQQRRVLARLEARDAAESALVEALEILRSGAVPLVSGPVLVRGPEAPAAGRGGDLPDDVSVVVHVVPAEPPAGLYRGRVLVRCTVSGQTVSRMAETQFWRPDTLKSH